MVSLSKNIYIYINILVKLYIKLKVQEKNAWANVVKFVWLKQLYHVKRPLLEVVSDVYISFNNVM